MNNEIKINNMQVQQNTSTSTMNVQLNELDNERIKIAKSIISIHKRINRINAEKIRLIAENKINSINVKKIDLKRRILSMKLKSSKST